MDHVVRFFSLSNIICTANAFSNAYQLSCCIFDPDMNIRYQSRPGRVNCQICNFLKEHTGQELRDDLTFHRKGCQQAKNLGGWYIYACPIGIQFFTVPVWNDDNEIIAYMVAGPISLRGLKDRSLFDSVKRRNFPMAIQSEFFEIIRGFPFLYLTEIETLARKLQMIVRCLQKSVTPVVMDPLKISLHFIESGEPLYSNHKKRDLSVAFLAFDQSLTNKIILDMLDEIYIGHRGIAKNMHAEMMEIITLLTRHALSCGADLSILEITSYTMILKVYQIQSFYELSTWVIKTTNLLMQQVKLAYATKNMEVVRQAMKYMCYNFTKKITLEDVSGYVYLSPTYFSKVFHQGAKCSFNTYLNYMRVEKSKNLLLSTRDSVTEIAKNIGFEDQSYFTKVFKRITGVTPGEYRRVSQKGPI